jgi:type I restriction enzyme S subunit
MSDNLPSNWESWRLADVGQWFGGGTPSSSEAAYWDGDIPWVSPKDMKVHRITSSIDTITEAAVANSAAKIIPEGAVLFVTRSGILAHSFPVATTGVKVTINQDLKAIWPVEVIDPKYLAWTLRSFERTILSSCSKHGTTVHSIEMPALKQLCIPVPPFPEQQRIVAKIEELFSELDKGVESLTTAREQLKAYRQTVLKHAFEGKLTEDWRAQRPGIETGTTLRKRILDVRRSEWEQSERVRLQAQGSVPANDRWKARYPEPEVFDKEDLPSLPVEWCWVGLDELVSGKPRSMQSGPFGSNLLHSEFQQTGVLVIGIDNVRDGEFSMGSQNRISSEKFSQLEKYQARPGDLLVTVMASLGRTCVVPRDLEPAIITKHVYRISMEESLVFPEFFNLLLQSQTVSRIRMFKSAQGQTRPGLNSSILKALPIPLCSRAEQVEIVSRLLSQLSNIDSMISQVNDEIFRAIGLRYSILKKAFCGQLVAQNPSDEPASSQLERIRAKNEKGSSGSRLKNNKNRNKEAA